MTDYLKKHLASGDFAPMGKGREAELAELARSGDSDAFNELVSRNIRLAMMVAYRHGGPVDDLTQEAVLGVIHAAGKFDPAKGRFSTYAMRWIRHYISDFLNKDSTVRIPVNRLKAGHDRRIMDELSDDIQSEPDTTQERVDTEARLHEALSKLTPSQRELLELRFGFNEPAMTLGETAARIGSSRETVRKNQERALTLMRRIFSDLEGCYECS